MKVGDLGVASTVDASFLNNKFEMWNSRSMGKNYIFTPVSASAYTSYLGYNSPADRSTCRLVGTILGGMGLGRWVPKHALSGAQDGRQIQLEDEPLPGRPGTFPPYR